MARVATCTRQPNQGGSVAGGYLTTSVDRLLLAWWLYESSAQMRRAGDETQVRLELLDLRMWLACLEVVERRRFVATNRAPRFLVAEFRQLTGSSHSRVQASLRRLSAAGLIQISATTLRLAASADETSMRTCFAFESMQGKVVNSRRTVPVPRRLLRWLVSNGSRTEIATVIGHLLRCVYLRGRAVMATGNCAARWVADVFGVHATRVKQARARLVRLGLFVEHIMPQWHRNRYGNRIEVNLSWQEGQATAEARAEGEGTASHCEPCVAADSRPPGARECNAIATPYIRNRTLLTEGLNNQTLRGVAPHPPTGAREQRMGARSQKVPAPSLVHVLEEDLQSTERLLQLHQQAASKGLVPGGERGQLELVALAEHARACATRSAVGLFAWAVKNYNRVSRLWLTGHDEERARRRLRGLRDGREAPRRPGAPRQIGDLVSPGTCGHRDTSTDFSAADREFAQRLRRALAAKGIRDDEMILADLCRVRPEWTRQRWLRATLPVVNCGAGH